MLQLALKSLSKELIPDEMPPEPSAYCKKMLALGLFYKCILNLCPKNKVNARYRSGGEIFKRPVSRGTQTFDTDKTVWPLNKPIPKLEAIIQCSGEALYANDLPSAPREVYVCFVLSTVCVGQIDKIDTKEALNMPGVIAFLSAKDIPGKNTFTPTTVPWQEFDEEILASDKISYYGQPIGVVAAVTEKLAIRAAKSISVSYKNISKKKPVLTIEDALNAPSSENRVRKEIIIKPKNKGVDTNKVIKGSFVTPSQYHYTMEPQCCVVVPIEDQLDVYSSTQWMDLVQVAVAGCLNIPENSVNVIVRRVGGAYGGKASRSAAVAAACALVARRLRRPARLTLPIRDNMTAIGKRQTCLANYEVEIDNNGVIQYLNVTYYSDCGFCFNDTSGGEIANTMTNLYDVTRWSIEGYSVLTDKASNTWCRAPGTTEGTAIIEHIMERIAHTVKKDSIDIKMLHVAEQHNTIKDMIMSFRKECDYDVRVENVKKINAENSWIKRAIKMAIMSYPIGYSGNFGVTISIYHADGTVAISHGGIEMGQGINTKIAQVCAHFLNIPLEKVSVKPSNSFVTPNAMASNGSITSECLAYAVMKACEDMQQKLESVKEELENPTWEETVTKAYNKGINLQSSYMTSINDELKGYNVYGVAIIEVELDALTGTHQILKVDILEDTGRSISPEIDVGQIEGAFVMGLGLWTSEQLIYDADSGRLLTDRTWTYKPPGAKDIPLDFRVSFRRNSLNPTGVLRSKATGEPALVLAVVVIHALQFAIFEARKEHGYKDEDWVKVDTPYSVDSILKAISSNTDNFKLI
ncbi:Xanthine dehydrogenase [Eumeta japonica]|uniref:Xanthine dehydrogenase n=1 Tax=Eumeta variegata TaxID=151549 RepID=A0A4C1V2W5_EUMVA|nr:Xanthine dehydrogenase [Eumeta japonica]